MPLLDTINTDVPFERHVPASDPLAFSVYVAHNDVATSYIFFCVPLLTLLSAVIFTAVRFRHIQTTHCFTNMKAIRCE